MIKVLSSTYSAIFEEFLTLNFSSDKLGLVPYNLANNNTLLYHL